MIYLQDPMTRLALNTHLTTLKFLCPRMTEEYKPFLRTAVKGQAEISVKTTKVKISALCTEGPITVMSEDMSYFSAVKKARKEFNRTIKQWMAYRYGNIRAFVSDEKSFEEDQTEVERVHIDHSVKSLIVN